MESRYFRSLRLLSWFLRITVLFGNVLPSCVIETGLDFYSAEYYDASVTTTITVICGEDEPEILPLDPATDRFPCDGCPFILTLKQIQGSSVPPRTFINYHSITILNLNNLGIETISPDAFETLINLKELLLNGNKLRSIPAGVLNSAGNLKMLDLSSNQIHSMNDVYFSDNEHLTSVNLSANSITLFETSISWNNISTIDLSNNKISNMDLKEFPTSLTVLNLSSNSLKSFTTRKNFTELDLSNNYLESFDLSFKNYTRNRIILKNNNISHISGTYCRVKEIDLSNNKLDSVPCDCSHNSPVIENLNLANNLISYLVPQTINELASLKELHLEGNRIKIIKTGTFAGLQTLTFLNISHNVIAQFEMGAVDNIKNIEVFDVSYNKLKQLNRFMMHTFGNLKHLHLEYNNITYINGTHLNEDLPNISDINIVGNNLSCHNIRNILTIFNQRPVHFVPGPFKNITNVHGMSCYFVGNITDDEFMNSREELEVNNGISDYFNHDYRGSNFFKYLEELQNTVSMVFNETRQVKKEIRETLDTDSGTGDLVANNASSFNGYLITIVLFLLSIACFLGFQVYVLFNKFSRKTNNTQTLL